MDEVYAEYIVKRKLTAKAIMARAGMIMSIIISILSFPFLVQFSFTITALLGYLTWYVFVLTDVEYEYSVINTALVVDKIMGQRKRKRITEYDLKKAEIMALAESHHLDSYKGRVKVADYSSGFETSSKMGLVFPNVKGDPDMLIFEPNERIIDAIVKFRPSMYKKD